MYRHTEPLESRRLLTTVLLADLPAGVTEVAAGEDRFVKLVGTDAADVIEFASEAADAESRISRLDVSVNGVERLTIVVDGDLERVEVDGRGGDDTIIMGQNLPVPAVLDGGDGNDLLGGGPQGDILLGGSGNDTLDGNAAGDLLDGEDGDDLLLGGKLADGAGVVFDSGEIDGEGGYLLGLRVIDALPFDLEVRYGGDETTFETTNTSLIDTDITFGGDGTDRVANHGRLFVGSEAENIFVGRDGPRLTPTTDAAQVQLDLRAGETDPTRLAAIALTIAAVPADGIDSTTLGEDFDDLVDQLQLLGDAVDVDVDDESTGEMFARRLVVDADAFSDEAILLTEARAAAVSSVRDAVLFVGEIRRVFEPQTFFFGDSSVTYDSRDGGSLSGVIVS